MKKLDKRLQELATAYESGEFETFVKTLSPGAISQYLDLIETKRRLIISESFRKSLDIEQKIKKIEDSFDKEQKVNGYDNSKLYLLKRNLKKIETKRKIFLDYLETLQNPLRQTKNINKIKRTIRKNKY